MELLHRISEFHPSVDEGDGCKCSHGQFGVQRTCELLGASATYVVLEGTQSYIVD